MGLTIDMPVAGLLSPAGAQGFIITGNTTAVENGIYIIQGSSTLTLTLPTTPSQGSTILVKNTSAIPERGNNSIIKYKPKAKGIFPRGFSKVSKRISSASVSVSLARFSKNLKTLDITRALRMIEKIIIIKEITTLPIEMPKKS